MCNICEILLQISQKEEIMNFKQKNRVRHVFALLLSVVMVVSLFAGNTVSVFAASSIAVPSWAENRLYFHTIANDTTDSHAWAVMESASTSTGSTPEIGSYSSSSTFRVFLPATAKNSDGTYLVYNNYGSDITIGGKTIGSGKTGYVSASANTVRIGSNSTCTLKIYTSNAEENVYFTHSGSNTKNKWSGTVDSSSDYVSALGLDWSKNSKSDAVVTNGNVTLVQADGTIDTTQTLKQIKGRGNTTWSNTNKKSWNFTLNDEKVSVGGMKKGKKYSLLANFQDPSLSRNRLLYDLADSVGIPYASDSRYADVYMDGLYIGSYLLTQKHDDLADLQDPVYSNGSVQDTDFIIELACGTQGDDFEITPGNGSGIISVTAPEPTNDSEKSALKSFIKGKYDALYNAINSSSTTYEELSKLADVESLAKIYLINELGKNFDSGVSSFYLTYENGKFYASPAWDYDNSLGNANYSGISDYKSTSGNWCNQWKGNSQSYNGNFVYRMAKNAVILDVARACWYGTSQNDTTSFVYNINKFANGTSTQATLGKNTGLLSKKYYAAVLGSSAYNNSKKWSIVPNSWCGGHTKLTMYTMDYDDLYKKLDTMDYSVSSSVSLSSSTRYYEEYAISTSSNSGGQYEFAADYMISRAAWMSKNMLQTSKSYSLTGNTIGWTSSLTEYKLSLKDKTSKIYGITNIDASLVTGYFKLNDGSAYIGPSGSSDVEITTATTYDSQKAYCVTGSISGATKAYKFSNPDSWSKVSVYYRPSDGKIWIAQYVEAAKVETIVAFNYDNTGKTAETDLDEYADSADSYTYLATTGNATLTGSVSGSAKKHLEWSSDDYDNAKGTAAGIVPVFGASASNPWASNANVTVQLSTKGYTDLTLSLQLGATKKGPANYVFYVTDGTSKEKLGTYTLSDNKTMCDVSFDIPATYANKDNVSILVQLANTTAINGNDIVGATGGEFAINNIEVKGKNNGSSPIVTPTPTVSTPTPSPVTPTPTVVVGTNKAVVYYQRSSSTSWTDAYIHYKVDNGTWTKSPGVKMEKVSAGYWAYTIDLGTQTGATVCFNNGNGTWDSNSSANYKVEVGTSLVTNGTVTKMGDVTPTPTVSTPTPSPVTPTPTVVVGTNKAVVYYQRSSSTSWTDAYVHYKVNGTWTKSPGVKMDKISAGYWMYTIDLGTATEATLCFNNGNGTWDNNSKANYTVEVGTSLVTNGTVTKMGDVTPTPTVTPTVTPTITPIVTPSATPEYTDYVTIAFDNSVSEWDNVYAYVWNSTTDAKVFTAAYITGKTAVFNITGSYKNIIFKNTEADWDQQTADLTLPAYTTSTEGKCFTPNSAKNKSEGTWGNSSVLTGRIAIVPSVLADKDTVAVGDTVKFTMTAEYENGNYKNSRYLTFTYEDGTTETLNSYDTSSYATLFEKVADYTHTYSWTPKKTGKVKVTYSVSEYEDHTENSQAITLDVKAASNTVKVYYKNSSWSKAYIHYKVNGSWTSVPGVQMQSSDRSDYTWMYTIDLGDTTSATVCFNNGNNSWDSNNSANYSVGTGEYAISGQKVTKLN